MYSKISLLVLLLLVLGCSTEKEKTSKIQEESQLISYPEFPSIDTNNIFVYECAGDSLQFTSHLTPDSTWLFLADSAVKLTPMKSTSGTKYTSEGYVYWSKGEKALLQIPGDPLRNCQTLPREKSWQAAKVRGVDFRAIGQEPGWFLEVTDNKQIKYVGRYGEDTISVPASDLRVDKNTNKVEYRAKSGKRMLTVVIEKKPCIDSMSGFKYPATVSVSIDGEILDGCGKSL